MKLFMASVFTILLLSGFLATITFSLLYVWDMMSVELLISLVIAWNFLLLLVSPKISDFIYRHFFGMQWMPIEDLRKRCKPAADFIEATCGKYRFNRPKLGIINDKNPNAFTYGSGRWNSRIIVTEGIFTYLDAENTKAVYGHELGHIKNRDFIVMTLASTIVQLLYVIARICLKAKSTGGRGKGKGYIIAVGIVAYVFYFIGQYVVLYLSRIREYYADQFSAQETKNPNALAVALVKIAYGIFANPEDVRLVKTTKNIGIMNVASSKLMGINYYVAKQNKDYALIDKTILYDIKNPWAFVSEISSTHPRTGMRIKRLCDISRSLGIEPEFDFEDIERKYPVDKGRMRSNFIKDFTVAYIPDFVIFLMPIIGGLWALLGIVSGQIAGSALTGLFWQFLFAWFAVIGFSILIKTAYKYPNHEPEKLRIVDIMGDVYASPVRGRRVLLDGRFIGKGIPGFVFSEDMMMQDKTGLMYMNYESMVPLLGNLYFAWRRVKNFIDKPVAANGWFLRSITQRVDLSSFVSEGKTIRSYNRWIGVFWGLFFIALAVSVGVFFGIFTAVI